MPHVVVIRQPYSPNVLITVLFVEMNRRIDDMMEDRICCGKIMTESFSAFEDHISFDFDCVCGKLVRRTFQFTGERVVRESDE